MSTTIQRVPLHIKTYSLCLSENEYRSSQTVHPPGMVDDLAALADQGRVLITGWSSAGKTTLQHAILKALPTLSRPSIFVDKCFESHGKGITSHNVIDQTSTGLSGLTTGLEVSRYSVHELRCCDHKGRISRGEPTICDQDLADLLVGYWARGVTGTVTCTLGGTTLKLDSFYACYPQIMPHLTSCVHIHRAGPNVTFDVYSLCSGRPEKDRSTA